LLEALISNKTRIKLIIRFFINPNVRSYLRELGREFSESSNAVRLELNRFEEAGLIISEKVGNKKYYRANQNYPLFKELQQISMKHFGLDQVIENVIDKLGHVNKVYLLGKLANGLQSNIIDLAIVTSDIDRSYLMELTELAEITIEKKIRCLILEQDELSLLPEPRMLIYESGK